VEVIKLIPKSGFDFLLIRPWLTGCSFALLFRRSTARWGFCEPDLGEDMGVATCLEVETRIDRSGMAHTVFSGSYAAPWFRELPLEVSHWRGEGCGGVGTRALSDDLIWSALVLDDVAPPMSAIEDLPEIEVEREEGISIGEARVRS
jgi:hypothetical protein